MKLFVSNLSFNTDSEDLERIFEAHGKVVSAKVKQDQFTNRSRGFGFVQMNNEAAALLAIKELHNTELKGQTIAVKMTTMRE